MPGGLTAEGREQARALGAALRETPIDLVVTTGFPRTDETADEAIAGRSVPRVVLPDLGDPRYGPYEGGPLEDYRAWAAVSSSSAVPGEGGESRTAIVERYARGYRWLLARPEADDPPRRPLAAARLRAPGPGRERACSTHAASRRTPRRIRSPATSSTRWPKRSRAGSTRRRSERHTPGMELLARIDAHISAPRPDRARRRGALPRLGRRGLDVSSARAAASSAIAPPRFMSTTASAAPSRMRTRASARRCSAPRSSALDGVGLTEAELRDVRYAQAPERLRATGHTASDQVETILYRLVTSGSLKGIKPRREDGVVRPLLPRLARGDRGVLPASAASPFRVDSSNAATTRGLIRGEILPLLEQIHPGRPREHPALARVAPHDAARARRAPRRARRLAAGRPRRRPPGRARARPALARARAGRASNGEVACGGWLIRSELPGLIVRGWRPGDRLAGRRRRSRTCSSTPKSPVPTAKAGRSWCAGARSSPFRASSRPTGSRRYGHEPVRARARGRRGPDRRGPPPEPHPRARRGDHARLRRPRAAARRRAQGRGLLHGRPHALDQRPLRDRLHGDLELRRLDRLLGRRPHPQGPRHQHRGPARARDRGHHRLRPHALLPDAQPRVARARRASRSARS